ncbi:MAG: tetratricopeptide repeat protein [Tepidisphaeraceae bacterium]|jgi:superkiller protein 3
MNDWHDAERRFERALEFAQRRQWPQALEEMRMATSINPFNAAWFFNLGLVLDEMGRFDEAIGAFRRAARIEPNNLAVQERLGIDLHRTQCQRQALETFAHITQADPAYEAAYCHRILIHAELGEHQQAEEMFYLARLYKEHCPRCYDYMGRSLAARKRYDRAIYCFQKCLDLEPAWRGGAARLARALWDKGDFEQARRQYLAELRLDPGSTSALLDLGDLLMEMGRPDEAGEKYRRCIELAPAQAQGYFRHGRWLSRRHHLDEAQAAFEQALKLDPALCGAHLELARLAFRRGDRVATRRHLRAMHLRHTRDGAILLAMANLWMDCGQDRTAMACLKRLISMQPNNADAWLNLAVAQFRRGNYEQGIQSCRRTLTIDRNNRLAMYNLALAHDRLRQPQAALQWARQAQRLDPRDSSVQRLELRLRVIAWFSSILAGFVGGKRT